jgi:hypothetical protein
MATFGRRTTCGTVACMAGWAGLDPEFNRQGLVFRISDDGWPNFELQGWPMDSAALKEFFGLSLEQFRALFLSWPDGTTRDLEANRQRLLAFIAAARLDPSHVPG